MNILKPIRKSKISKCVSIITSIAIISQDVQPLMALSGGPKTPETTGFSATQPAENVNLYTGDFQYTIPLFQMNDYPFTLTYDSNISPEQEASWVGLGWNLDIGSIDRQVKGLPDDFKNDIVKQEDNQKPNITVMLGIGKDVELIGINPANAPLPKKIKKFIKSLTGSSFQIGYNNYNGFIWNLSGSSSPMPLNTSKNTEFSAGLSLGWSIGSGGISVFPSLSMGLKKDEEFRRLKGDVGLTFNVNSTNGIQNTQFAYSLADQKLEAYHLGKPDATGSREVIDFHYVGDSHGGSISYQQVSFPPKSNIRYQNFTGSATVKVPIETFWTGFGTSFSGYFGMQKIHQKTQNLKAIGYLYMENTQYPHDVLTDIYREKDVGYIPGVPALPQTQAQADVFSVHSRPVNGNFRAFKNTAVVTGYSNFIANKGTDIKLDFEFGAGNAFKGALNPTFGTSKNTQGWWLSQNGANTPLKNIKNLFLNDFSNVYFKRIDEPGKIIDASYYNAIVNDKAVAFDIQKNLFSYYLKNQLKDENGSTYSGSSIFQQKFNQLPEFSTTFLPVLYGQIVHHPLYNKLYKQYYQTSTMPTVPAQPHHITHIEITNENGQRLVFGCPAYNHIQKEVSFNVSDAALTSSISSFTSQTTIYSANDASINNSQGLSHHYHAQTTPPYVYAYHLTEVYSSEYSDLTGDGPTPDDAGDYLVFHYTRKIAKYKWRSPMTSSANYALYNPGSFSKNDDATGVYTYGEKDVWYVDTIRSKTETAVFYTSPRYDAAAAAGEHGAIDNNTHLYRLDSIVVFDNNNLLDKQSNPGVVIYPKKRIIFNYDYSLCPGTVNSIANSIFNPLKGKLTLKSVEILEGYSYSQKRSAYQFTYSLTNPSYAADYVDRWGNYKTPTLNLGNILYPYTPQDFSSVNIAANAWRLTKITTPGSGSIEVFYEPDDYQYVQNKRAMRMLLLYGIHNSPIPPTSLSTISTSNASLTPDSWLVFKTDIPFSFSLSQAQAEFQKYFQEDVIDKMYFRALVNVTIPGSSNYSPVRYEYVNGFAEIQNKTIFQSGGIYYGAVQLKKINYHSKDYHPFEMAAQQWVMTSAPLFYQDKLPINSGNVPQDIVQGLVNEFINAIPFFVNQFQALIQGPYKYMKSKGIGSQIYPQYSWIRLCTPKKYSSTSRVKKIVYSNNWQSKTSEANADISHIKEYYYVLPDGTSSGVASNEPSVGNDENCLYTAMAYQNNSSSPSIMAWTRKLIPRQEYLYYFPLNASQYPGSSIGYSRVIVKTVVPSSYKSTGWEEHTFYTAKDYPTVVKQTPLIEHHPVQNIPGLFVSVRNEHVAVSQGFCTIVNDMPGRSKETKIYDGDSNLVTHKTSYYSLDKIKFLNKNNTVFDEYFGLDADVVIDWREEISNSPTYQFQFNLDFSILPFVPPLPILIPTTWPNLSFSDIYFRSSVVNKTIYQHAVLTKETIIERGADLSVHHRVLDPVTGKDLITSTKSKFGKEEFSYQLPAYHVYPQMKSSGSNTGIINLLQTDNSGKIISPFPIYLTEGDKLLDLKNNRFMWIYKHNNDYYLIDQQGNVISNLNNPMPSLGLRAFTLVYQSGYTHRLDEKAEQYTMKKNPVSGNIVLINTSKEILSASASTYTDYFSIVSDSCKAYCASSNTCVTTKTLSALTAIDYSYSCTSGWGTVAPTPISTSSPVGPATPVSMPSSTISVPNASIYTVGPTFSNSNTSSNSNTATSSATSISTPGSNITSSVIIATPVSVSATPVGSTTMAPANFAPPSIPIKIKIADSCGCKSDIQIITHYTFTGNCNYSITCLNNNVSGIYSVIFPTSPAVGITQQSYALTNVCPGTYSFLINCSSTNTVLFYYNVYVTINGGNVAFNPPQLTLNPYVYHLKNAWRPYQSFVFLTSRTPSATNQPENLPQQSHYLNVTRFWQFTVSSWSNNSSQWKLVHTVTYMDINGHPIEERDISGIYSTAWFNVFKNFQEGIAYNARSEEIAAETFEYYYTNSGGNSPIPHFYFFNALNHLSTTTSHTGLYSAKLSSGDSIYHQTFITSRLSKKTFGTSTLPPYQLWPGYYSDKFAPFDTTRTFHISLWAKCIPANLSPSNTLLVFLNQMSVPNPCYIDSSYIQIRLNNTSIPLKKIYESPDIEGWKQYKFEFTLQSMAPCDRLRIKIWNPSNNNIYVDDIRIEPADANSKVFVYHSYKKLLMATLDENGFATRYIYNERNELQNISKETDRGNLYILYKKIEKSDN